MDSRQLPARLPDMFLSQNRSKKWGKGGEGNLVAPSSSITTFLPFYFPTFHLLPQNFSPFTMKNCAKWKRGRGGGKEGPGGRKEKRAPPGCAIPPVGPEPSAPRAFLHLILFLSLFFRDKTRRKRAPPPLSDGAKKTRKTTERRDDRLPSAVAAQFSVRGAFCVAQGEGETNFLGGRKKERKNVSEDIALMAKTWISVGARKTFDSPLTFFNDSRTTSIMDYSGRRTVKSNYKIIFYQW